MTIGDRAFYECSSLSSVTIPNSVTTIGAVAFAYCNDLTSVYYNTENPIESTEDVFNPSTYSTATLYVPEGAVEKCKTTDPWYRFNNIQAFDFSGIEEIKAELDLNSTYNIYNLNGVKVNESIDTLAPGTYIIRQGETMKKIIVR